MFLIMSGSYVQSELNAEFGLIPPSFLPLGNRRLFQHQIELAPKNCSIYLSIPDSYELNDIDKNWLSSNNISIIKTPSDLNLGQALAACLNLLELPSTSSLHLLFGDTLFSKLPEGDDVLAVSEVKNNYRWSSVNNNSIDWMSESDDSKNVVCGYFKFSQPHNLIQNITQESWDFIKGINRYKKEIGLSQVLINDWYDFGHVNTYYHSKAAFTTQRSFNDLIINTRFIEKSSVKNKKIKAEANWFELLPSMLRSYIPQYLGSWNHKKNRFSYRLEYLHNTALNELFVFSEMPNIIWRNILEHCLNFIDDCKRELPPPNAISQTINELFCSKTSERISDFCNSRGIKQSDEWFFNNEFSVSISTMLAETKKYLPTDKEHSSVMHGDFCFSNILYDFRADRIKTIDPRGITNSGEITIYGDTNYDLAKLSHSILGMYDWILAGYHHTDINWENKIVSFKIAGDIKHKDTQTMFIEMVSNRYGLNAANLHAMQLQLFLSMLPLHGDDSHRQGALFANAFRIYQIIKRCEK